MTTPPTCACGMFAVALCVTCSAPVCHEHHGKYQDRVYCHACSNAPAERERQAREEAIAAQQRSTRQTWEALVSAAPGFASRMREGGSPGIRRLDTDPRRLFGGKERGWVLINWNPGGGGYDGYESYDGHDGLFVNDRGVLYGLSGRGVLVEQGPLSWPVRERIPVSDAYKAMNEMDELLRAHGLMY